MLRTLLYTVVFLVYAVIFLVIALGGGIASFDYITRYNDGFNKLTLGVWQAAPEAGSEKQDIYAKAYSVRFDYLSIGAGEGLVFQAWNDEAGNDLNPACTYEIAGHLPEASFYTLYAVSSERTPLKTIDSLPAELYSRALLFSENGEVLIRVSPTAQPGNWLAVLGNKPYGLVLTLYNTSAARTSGLSAVTMPKLNIVKQAERNCG